MFISSSEAFRTGAGSRDPGPMSAIALANKASMINGSGKRGDKHRSELIRVDMCGYRTVRRASRKMPLADGRDHLSGCRAAIGVDGNMRRHGPEDVGF